MVEERAGPLRVAVRGGGGAAASAAAGVERVGADEDPDVVTAVGEDALIGLADDLPDAPVVPSWPGGGPHVVPPASLGTALESVAAGDVRIDGHPVLGVTVEGRTAGRALMDATLVTSDPARISEYGVHARGERVASARADGVTVATPLGSAGYARTAGGPLLAPGTGVAVVYIAPFTTNPDVRVLRPNLELSVERDEGPVSLVLDDAIRRRVGPDERVAVRRAATVDVAVVSGTGADG
ncbi:MAG: hypothetical protein ABEJ34_03310 [Haloferacaceae archaeon]